MLKMVAFLIVHGGLGYGYDTEYVQIENDFIQNIRKLKQGQITGELIFKTYDNYKKFVDFAEGANNLKFVYRVPFKSRFTEYFKDIDISNIEKTEIGTDGVLRANAMFECKSLWYEETTAIYTIEPQSNEIRWNFEWDSRFADYDTRSLQHINKGHVEAPILVEISGHVINPKIELYVEGELYQTVPITVDIKEFEKLLYGTKSNDFYINKQNTDGTITSLFSLEHIDFANDNVIRLPTNRSCELRITADNEVLNAQVTILTYYKAV